MVKPIARQKNSTGRWIGLCVLGLGFLATVLFAAESPLAKTVAENKPGLWGCPAWYSLLMVASLIGVGGLLRGAVCLAGSGSDKKVYQKYVLLLILVSLGRGALYSALIPPWQSPDEHAHFEYAALLGLLGRIPTLDDLSDEVQSRVVSSMFQYDFWRLIKRPSPELPPVGLLVQSGITEDPPTHTINNRFLYYPQVGSDPPLYYVAPALVYVALRQADTALQLYGMRLTTVAMLAALVAVATWVLQQLFPDDLSLVVGSATCIAFLPMVTYMGGVLNNDILAAVFTTVVLGVLIVMLRNGFRWRYVFILSGVVGISLFTKYNTIWLLPLIAGLGLGYGCRHSRVVRYIAGITGIIAVAFLASFFMPAGRARYWTPAPAVGDTATVQQAWAGAYALRVAGSSAQPGRLTQSLLSQVVLDLRGHSVSLTAWVRAEASGQTGRLALLTPDNVPIAKTEFVVGDQWRQVTLRGEIPDNVSGIQVALEAGAGAVVYFDEVAVADLVVMPTQVSLLRNGLGEEESTWGEIIAVKSSELVKLSRPVQRFFSVWQDNLRALKENPWPLELGLQSFWGNLGAALAVPLQPSLYKLLNAVCLASAAGMVVYVYRALSRTSFYPAWQRWALAMLGMALLLALVEVVVPVLAMYGHWAPQGRYLFPVIVPIATFIILGLSQLLPRRVRQWQPVVLLLGLVWLDYAVLRLLIDYFYHI